MSFDTGQASFQRLLRTIREGKVQLVPFVGAGLSVYGEAENRLPQWSELLDILRSRSDELGLLQPDDASEIAQLIAERQLIAATDRLVHILGEAQFRLAIEEVFDTTDKAIPPAILELVCIAWSLIVTTNLDRFIETAWSSNQESAIRVLTNLDAEAAARAISGADEPTLLKTHGTVERFKSWVLSKSHYDFLLERNRTYVEALKLLYTKSLFFVGYGLVDHDFEPLLEQLHQIFPTGVGRYFALLADSWRGTELANRLIRKYGLQPIWFSVDETRYDRPDCGFGEVTECLQHLVRAWVTGRKSTPVVLGYFPEPEQYFVGRTQELKVLSKYVFDLRYPQVQVIGFGGEGKTTLVRHWLQENAERFTLEGFSQIIGCSFYKADVGRFVDIVYGTLHPNGHVFHTPGRMAAIKESLRQNRILLALDGLESLQTADGELRNPYLSDIMEAARSGRGSVVITSRIKLPNCTATILLEPLAVDEVITLFRNWRFAASDEELRRAISDHIGTHALSARIIAGHLSSTGITNIHELAGLDAHHEIHDEADPLRTNKATRVLAFYEQRLPVSTLNAVRIFCLFRKSVPIPVFEQAYAHVQNHADSLISESFHTTLNDLFERGLIVSEEVDSIAAHPLVREYFSDQLEPAVADDLHSFLLERYLARATEELPDTLEQCYPLFEACFHAAKAKNFAKYHDIAFRRLNWGQLKRLGWVYGVWEEILDLSRLVFANEDLAESPRYMGAYYHGFAAFALQRLGRAREAVDQYCRGIDRCFAEGVQYPSDMELGMQINCLFSLCIALGKLAIAYEWMPLNFAAANQISDPGERDWQREHAFITCGRLVARMGDLNGSAAFFRAADEVRTRTTYDYREHHSLERIWFVDTLVAQGQKCFALAEHEARDNLKMGEARGFGDVVCGAYRTLSTLSRARAARSRSKTAKTKHLDAARRYLVQALEVVDQRTHDELEIQVQLEAIRLCLDFHRLSLSPAELPDADQVLRRLSLLLHRSSLDLYLPEVKAATAAYRFLQDRFDEAKDLTMQAVNLAHSTGDQFIFRARHLGLRDLMQSFGMSLPRAAKRISTPAPQEYELQDLQQEQLAKRCRELCAKLD